MGKIKSAKEIAMEKVEFISSHEEDKKEDSAHEYSEYLKAAKILAESLLSKKTDTDHIKESVARYPEEVKDEVAKVFMRSFAKGIDPENTGDILTVLRFLSDNKALLEACNQVENLLEQFLAEAAEKAATGDVSSQEGMRKILNREGISGTAIYSVNIEETLQGDTPVITDAMKEDYFTRLSGFRSFLEWQS